MNNPQNRYIELFRMYRINGIITIHVLQLAFLFNIMFSNPFPYSYEWI